MKKLQLTFFGETIADVDSCSSAHTTECDGVE